jgi:ABC-2 type transport system permease protein
MGARFHIHRLARVFGGFFMIGWSLTRLGVVLTPINLTQLVLALTGGNLTYTGVFIFSSAISFWTIQALDWIYIFTNTSYQVAKTPPQYLPRWLKDSFTFLMPMLAFAYYPAAGIGGWGPLGPGWLALPAGVGFIALSGLMWRVGVRYYSSTGS